MTNAEFNELFRKRTQDFALTVLKFLETVPFNTATKVMSNQLVRASTSVGSNFRAFCRGRSQNERFSKICIVVEEADESEYWLELFEATEYGDQVLLSSLIQDSREIVKITSRIKNSLYSSM